MTVKASPADLEKIRSISAEGGFAGWQKLFFLLTGALVAFGLYLDPIETVAWIVQLFILAIFAGVLFWIYIAIKSGGGMADVSNLLDDSECPVVTIVSAVRGEEAVLQSLVDNLSLLDYPKDKLQIMIIADEDDKNTCNAAWTVRKPSNVEVWVVPDSWEGPRGKPRALYHFFINGVIRGEFVVVYDGEDSPEPDQVRKAATAFRNHPDVDALQAELRWWNANQMVQTLDIRFSFRDEEYERTITFTRPLPNPFTRFIASGYALTRIWQQGLAATGCIFPLGGTSNFIRTSVLRALDFYDMFNVTEDTALGGSLWLAGCKTLTLPSVTWEEATSTYRRQVKQYSRWIKGRSVTAMAFTRDMPLLLRRFRSPKDALAFFCVILLPHLALLAAPFFWGMTIIFALTGAEIVQEVTPFYAFYMGTICLAANVFFIWIAGLALIRTGQFKVWPWIFLLPLYWMTVLTHASWKAVWEIFTGRMYYWDKTQHGLVQRTHQVPEFESNMALGSIQSFEAD